jgi:hypothetical protein
MEMPEMNVVEETPVAAVSTPVMEEPTSDDEDDTLSYFAKLAKES